MSQTRKAGIAKGDATHSTHNADNPAPEAFMAKDTINISLQQFRIGIKRYTLEEQELLEWLWGYTFDVLGNSKTELLRAIGYDYKFVYNVFVGNYDGSLDGFTTAIQALKIRAASKMPLVKTIVAERIIETLDAARDSQSMATICGPTGRGKTYTAKYWARMNNHGRTRYIRVPSGCTRRALAVALASACGIGHNGVKTSALEQKLFKGFTERNVIIVDEAGHLLPRSSFATTATIELLRDIHDICGCAVVMIFTDVYLQDMRQGKMADYFEQFFGRIKWELKIPNKVFRGEVEDVVKSFNPNPTDKLVEYAYSLAMKREGKLRMLFEDLKRASAWSKEKGRELILDDLKLAVSYRQSGGIWPEE